MKKQKKETPEQNVIQLLLRLYSVEPFLSFSTPWELLMATILSAQCTDHRVNQVTPALFAFLPTPEQASLVSPLDVEPYIQSVNYYHTKSRHICQCGVAIQDHFSGIVPSTMNDLVTLPGVGRKTANVVLAQAFHKSEGIAVDTHVSRVSYRLGWTEHSKHPLRIEQLLMMKFPSHLWETVSILLIHHGRSICKAKKPLCKECILTQYCNRYQTQK
ncbi:MAG: endonuclease III [Caldisericia bacterium]|nr:endonuclease III [Caldisericia bacterium]MDD4614099.1 endonuclease III [Caldisericia bacterium]